MAPFSVELWLLLALIGAAAVLALLGRIAQAIEDEKIVHLARIKADELRRSYAAQLAAQKSQGEVIEVDIVEDEPVAPPAAALAA
jgi:hypothetical protein